MGAVVLLSKELRRMDLVVAKLHEARWLGQREVVVGNT